MNAEILMYRAQNGKRVIVFGGILAGKRCEYEDYPGWKDAFSLARQLGVEIKRAYGYKGPITQ